MAANILQGTYLLQDIVSNPHSWLPGTQIHYYLTLKCFLPPTSHGRPMWWLQTRLVIVETAKNVILHLQNISAASSLRLKAIPKHGKQQGYLNSQLCHQSVPPSELSRTVVCRALCIESRSPGALDARPWTSQPNVTQKPPSQRAWSTRPSAPHPQ